MPSIHMTEAQVAAHQAKVQGKPKPKGGTRSRLEEDLVGQLRRIDVPDFEINYRWHSTREWMWDLAFVDLRIAVEVDGLRRDGKGDHQKEAGVTNDCQKQAHGILFGWTVLRFTKTMVKSGEAAELIQKVVTRQGLK